MSTGPEFFFIGVLVKISEMPICACATWRLLLTVTLALTAASLKPSPAPAIVSLRCTALSLGFHSLCLGCGHVTSASLGQLAILSTLLELEHTWV